MPNTRTVESLHANAELFWPRRIAELEQESSVIPILIQTQDAFISLLHVANKDPDSWKKILAMTNKITPQILLKHALVLSDIGGEKLKRLKSELPGLIDNDKMTYVWQGEEHTYIFKTLSKKTNWSNPALGIDGKGLQVNSDQQKLTEAMEDILMLVFHGGASLDPRMPREVLDKCVLGGLMGQKKQLDDFVRQRYIWVSRITQGAQSNALGQLAQQYVKEHLRNCLPSWDFNQTTIPGISHNDGRTNISFDIVVQSPLGRYTAIEVSFQVTTNSVIERKAGQARSRYSLLSKNGHAMAFVLDGAGNFERRSALKTIVNNCDIAVTFKASELNELVAFLQQREEGVQ